MPRSSLIRVYTVCRSVCIVWTRYSMVEPHSSNFRVITTIVLGVRIFRKFTIFPLDQPMKTVLLGHLVNLPMLNCQSVNLWVK